MAFERFGRYRLLKRLAVGGMAEIFLARAAGTDGGDRLVVVKRILPQLAENQEFVQMFLDEARIAARLDHPNIARILDLGEEGGTYFIAMEYLHGEDVRRVYRRAEAVRRALPVPVICRIVMEVATGLAHAHRRADEHGRPMGIVHRDVSPQNILVTFTGRVKVVDFGIAKAIGKATQTRSGVLKGKYSYMSPEQAATQPVDHRSDLFALGIVFFELLTGTRLFKRSTDVQTLNAVVDCRVPRPSRVRPGLPEALDAVVLKALASDPADRFQDGRELEAAIEQWLRAERIDGSTVAVAAFMQDLYRERLERERTEGHLLVDEIGAQSAPPTTPGPGGFSPPSDRSRLELDAEPDTDLAREQSVRAESWSDGALSRTGAETVATLNAPLRRRYQLLLSALALVAVASFVASAVLFAGGRPSAALVRIETEPAGAMVVVAGKAVPQLTPCTLPPLPVGRHSLRLGKQGYLDVTQDIVIPASGQVTFPVIRLLPVLPGPSGTVRVGARTPSEVRLGKAVLGRTPFEGELPPGEHRLELIGPAGQASCPVRVGSRGVTRLVLEDADPRCDLWGPEDPRARLVRLWISSVPAGATVSLGDRVLGSTPISAEVEPGARVVLRLRHPERPPVERHVEVGTGAGQEIRIELGPSGSRGALGRDSP